MRPSVTGNNSATNSTSAPSATSASPCARWWVWRDFSGAEVFSLTQLVIEGRTPTLPDTRNQRARNRKKTNHSMQPVYTLGSIWTSQHPDPYVSLLCIMRWLPCFERRQSWNGSVFLHLLVAWLLWFECVTCRSSNVNVVNTEHSLFWPAISLPLKKWTLLSQR